MFIGIISYLPADEGKRIERKKVIQNSIKHLLKIFPADQIKVCAQNYKEEDYIDGLDYIIKSKEGFGCGGARNELLKIFYASDEDYCMLLDDDTVLYDTPCSRKLFELLNDKGFLRFKNVDAICGTETYNKKHVRISTAQLTFEKMPFEQLNGLLIIKNFKKYYGEEHYYENTNCEDELFRFSCLADKCSYKVNELIYDGVMGGPLSTLGDFITTAHQDLYYYNGCRVIWDRYGVKRLSNGKYDFENYPQKETKPFIVRMKSPNLFYEVK